MNSSPITTWDHASVFFTFANHESIVVAILLASIVLTALVIVKTMQHEKSSEAALLGAVDMDAGVTNELTSAAGTQA